MNPISGVMVSMLVLSAIDHGFSLKSGQPRTGFTKLHMGLMVLVKIMSVLNNFLLQNTNLVSVLSKICPNFAGHV
jgi:hypothetical protein